MAKFTEDELLIIEKTKTDLEKLLSNGDTECVHGMANDLLCDLLIDIGLYKVVDKYDEIDKWYA